MNVTAHQKQKKNGKMKTGKKKAGELRREATDFKEALCCPSEVVYLLNELINFKSKVRFFDF